MKVSAQFENIEEMELTITMTGTIAEYEILLENCDKHWRHPMDKFTGAIRDRIAAAKNKIQEPSVRS